MKNHCYNIINSAISIEKKKIAVIINHNSVFYNCDTLIRIEAEGSYSNLIFATDHRYMVSKPIISYELKLPVCAFFRPHRSHLINFHYVTGYNRKERIITMADNFQIHLARENKQKFETFLEMYVI